MTRASHKSRWVASLLVAWLLACGPLCAAPGVRHRAVREQIAALETQWRLAQLSDDTVSMDRLLADDFLGITANGAVVTKAQQLERMRARIFVLNRLDVSDSKIKLISHHAAIVTSLAIIDGSSDGHHLGGSFRYTRVYQKLTGGAWKITSFEATRVPGPVELRAAKAVN